MARPILSVLLALTFACTSTHQETSTQDSTAVDNTVSSISTTETTNTLNVEEETSDATESVQDSSQLITIYGEQVALATNDEAKYYIVSLTVSQYEGIVSATWHFDKTLSPRYYNESWSFEGNEGVNEMIIENEAVVCMLESDNYSEEKWCAQTGGMKSEGEEEVTVSSLPPDYNTTADRRFEERFNVMKNVLRGGKIISDSPDSYIVRVESTVDVGQEVTEYTEVDIPKVVYDKLMK
jgi:hypothetical protein